MLDAAAEDDGLFLNGNRTSRDRLRLESGGLNLPQFRRRFGKTRRGAGRRGRMRDSSRRSNLERLSPQKNTLLCCGAGGHSPG